MNVEHVFELLGKTTREPQMRMMLAVAEALRNKSPVIVDAPTGCGKSLAYLVPSMAYAVRTGQRVIVSTKTKALQDQIAREMPEIASAVGTQVGRQVRWALLKGRGAFVCQKALKEAETPVPESLAGWIAGGGEKREEAPHHTDEEWREVSVGVGECTGKKCPFAFDCEAQRQREFAFGDTDIVIVNHKLLSIQLATDGTIIPDSTVFIVDESHEFEDVLAGELGRTLTPAALKRAGFLDDGVTLLNMLPAKNSGVVVNLEKLPDYLEKLLPEISIILAARISTMKEEIKEKMREDEDPPMSLVKALRRAERLLETSTRLLDVQHDEIMWMDERGVWIRNVDVGPFIEATLGQQTSVFTSATVCGERYGLKTAKSVSVGGGFNRAALYVPAVTDPKGVYQWRQDVADSNLELIRELGGRTLLLFTSWKSCDDMTEWLRSRLPFRVWKQGEPKCVEEFKADETSVLCGVDSLWTGIDCPGSTLSMVVVDRLPMPHPSDPVLRARSAVAGGGFQGWRAACIPPTRVTLAQGAGRLLRGPGDVGLIVINDPRVVTKARAYGDAVTTELAKFQRYDRTTSMEFIRRLRMKAELV